MQFKMATVVRYFILLLFMSSVILAVDKSNFKTCEQSSFCRRLRKVPSGLSHYELNLDTLQINDNSIEASLVNTQDSASFKFSLSTLDGGIFHIFADEVNPLHKRYKVEGVIDGEPQVASLEVLERSAQSVSVKSGENTATLYASPFKIEFARNNKILAVVNERGLFTIEHLRKKPEEEAENEANKDDPGAWEENFKSHHDTKPRGPEALAMDITFPGAARAYGLPQHADKLALRTTGAGGLDPYRLYNLDVFEYELDLTMALYGSIPVMYAHGAEHTVGVFWLNSAETWVDVTNSKDANVVSSIVNLVSGQKQQEKVEAHFMSESGVIDVYFLMGPKPADAIKQYARLTGVAPLPQMFTLGYHQCRWNYNDEDDVRNVVEKFDDGDFPMDVMWLDIEYTDGKKYFTWDPIKFAHPEIMQHNLTATGRKLVTIIDPHVKREGGYFLHEDALANDYYVKNTEGNVYEGWCWPGSSSYPDFTDPKVADYYQQLYSLDKFKGSTDNLYIWNDMNEPSVFNGPEVTMPKDLLHFGGWEHRHIHNLYGLLYTMVTYKGLLARNSNKRPFSLTRSHFAGSQRYTALWTGDNAAEWPHLAASYPMCLSEALAGLSFCGADVGGFFNNPDPELIVRWYQAAVWLPFYRAHAHIDTKRREPYLFSAEVQTHIRNALKLRYAHLPLWYTLFWEHGISGEPVIRPLFYHYPQDTESFDIDSHILVGSSVLATYVSEASATSLDVYLPGGSNQYWYDIYEYKVYSGIGYTRMAATIDRIPAFYKGGAIIPRKDRPRRASSLMHNDPYTLYVCLDSNGSASGTLYIDDGESFDYKKKKYLYIQFDYHDKKLTSKFIDKHADFETLSWLERVIILGAPKGIQHAQITTNSGQEKLQTKYDGSTLIIRKPGNSMREKFTISLH